MKQINKTFLRNHNNHAMRSSQDHQEQHCRTEHSKEKSHPKSVLYKINKADLKTEFNPKYVGKSQLHRKSPAIE